MHGPLKTRGQLVDLEYENRQYKWSHQPSDKIERVFYVIAFK